MKKINLFLSLLMIVFIINVNAQIVNTDIYAGNDGSSSWTNDIVMDSIIVESTMTIGNIDITGRVRNMGSNPITSFDVVYKIDGGTTSAVYSAKELNIASNKTFDFTHNIPWTITTSGNHSIEITLSNPNGNRDVNTEDNKKAKNILVVNEIYSKTVVCEEAGGTWCGWCPRGLVGLNTMAHNHTDGSWIGIAVHVSGYCHSNYLGEPMHFADYQAALYSFISGVPGSIIDRHPVAIDPATGTLETAYNEHMNEDPVAKIEVSDQTWSSSTRDFSVEITTTFALDIPSADYNAGLIVIENDVTGTDAGWNQHDYYQGMSSPMIDWDGFNYNTEGTLVIEGSDYVPAAKMHYNHVARQLIPGWAGASGSIPTSVTYDTPYTYTFTGSIPTDQNENNIEYVALVIDNTTGYIVNATKVGFGETTVLVTAITVQGQGGVSTITTQGGTLQMEATILPDNATNNSVTWSVVNGTGSATINTNGLLTATGDGTVTVTATADDASGVTDSTVITISNQGVGILELTDNNISIYPNPSSDFILIDTEIELQSVTIYSFNGRIVFNNIFSQSNEKIDIRNLSAGSYVLVFISKGGATHIKKWIKE